MYTNDFVMVTNDFVEGFLVKWTVNLRIMYTELNEAIFSMH